ncbi:acyltransferase domain-containing protein [Actinomadura sp. KC06]|uniref:acyltransferase domain-containing protein n=1 Tax=Actinomadura sp. KC06 TaxID=2530369 RepID=UPI0010521E00|nr:acyltransferase domain-containing protein [Actinomadura sp. KC06]TDD28859.1 acyltransferase domain-containing protein [Actinomadura sp. KC06]
MADIGGRSMRASKPNVVHIFPGQGNFPLTPLRRAVASSGVLHRCVWDVFTEADPVGAKRGIPVLRKALLGTRQLSGRDLAAMPPGTAQLALFGVSAAIHRALCELSLAPDAVVGVSFGEIAALCAAGSLSVPDGARAALAVADFLPDRGRMTVLNTTDVRTQELLHLAGATNVAIACRNSPTETVISGPLDDLAVVEALARQHGVNATRINLPVLCHHPSLTAEARGLSEALHRLKFTAPKIPMYSAVAQRRNTAQDDLAQSIADCLIKPLSLPTTLAALPPTALVAEVGTGGALARSVRTILPAATVCSPVAEEGFPWHDMPALWSPSDVSTDQKRGWRM